MDEMQKLNYCMEIAQQCSNALAAWGMINAELSAQNAYLSQLMDINTTPDQRMALRAQEQHLTQTTSRVFSQLQHLLNSTASVSKMFYPPLSKGKKPKPQAEARARELRLMLGVPNGIQQSPIGPRTVRDCFEHVEERMDKQPSSGAFVDKNISSPGDIVVSGLARHDLRHYDPVQQVVRCEAEHPFSLTPAIAELTRLRAKVHEMYPWYSS